MASRLTKAVRSYDAVARYGGEEFLVVLPGCEARLGAERAECIRMAINSCPVQTPSGMVPVSMSIGIAGADQWKHLSGEQLIHEADIALYRAKELGRNRAVLAKPTGLEEIHHLNSREGPVHAD